MESELNNAVFVTPSTKIRFKCTGCGECCRHVKESVPISCQDAFYLTKYLRDTGADIYCIDQFLSEYATSELLDDCGFFVYYPRCYRKVGNPFQTKQGSRPSCRDQEGRRGSEEVVRENLGVPLEGDRDVGALCGSHQG